VIFARWSSSVTAVGLFGLAAAADLTFPGRQERQDIDTARLYVR